LKPRHGIQDRTGFDELRVSTAQGPHGDGTFHRKAGAVLE
jgi:hypothetical protein